MADRIADLEFHLAAKMFPEMGQDDLNNLYESVKKNGVQRPIVLYQGKLLDGRNRVRAALMCGIPSEDLPRVTLPDTADPYEFAWMMNCERLDYSASQKAELRLEIEKASGELDALRRDAEEAKRSKLKKGNETQAPSRDRQMAVTGDPRKANTAAKLAAKAGVSQRTMERAIAAKSTKPKGVQLPRKVSTSTMWRVPRGVARLATFLLQRMPSDDIQKLVKLLTDGIPVEEAA